MPSPSTLLLGAVAGAAFLLPAVAQDPAVELRYGRDVRPILADRCFRCHGPDATARQGKLRLDERDAAIAAREHGAAIVPGKPEQSQLLLRVAAHDADERMPPADSGKLPLNEREIATLRAWIAAGATYEAHWSFVPPVAVAVPPGVAPHPVDRFLEQARHARGLTASPPADRTTLVRRVFLVLTGLPPTPEELSDALADTAADAYERLVDRLLGDEPWRTRSAEHQATMWLDAARYADTSGIHMDAGRQAWAWRDWLIDALRDDKPFDQFVLEQLAGDLLPNATTAQRIATGFLRNHVTTDEGGAIDEEYRVEYAAERTATLGSVFLGLTLNCARCHDHKYDPIKQEDYYRLFAFFNSNKEPGLYSQAPDANRALEPFLPVPTMAQQQQQAQLQQDLAAAEKLVSEISPQERAIYDAFRAELRARLAANWATPEITEAHAEGGSTLAIEAPATVVASGKNPPADVHVLTLRTTLADARWLCLEALTSKDLPEGKVGRAPNGNAVLQHVRLETRPAGGGEWTTVSFLYGLSDVEQDDGDYVVTNVFDDDDRGWAVGAHKAGPRPARAMLLATAPFTGSEATELRVTLKYDSPYPQHVFGRVRLQVGTMSPALCDDLPLATSGFHVAGPFERADGGDLYATHHGPEQATRIDRTARWGKIGWRFDDRYKNGVATDTLPKGVNATYVAQRVYAASPRTATVKLGSDDGFQLFVNGAMVAERRVDRPVAVDQDEAKVALPAGASLLVLKVINTGGDGGFAIDHVAPEHGLPGDVRLLALPGIDDDQPLQARIAEAFRELRSPNHRQNRATVARLRDEIKALEASIPRAMVFDEAPEPRATFVLQRGEYDKPDKTRPVTRELPAVFGKLADDQPKNRLGLARWLVSEQNPLLLRVQANRLWEFVFGTGLVRTSEDFGLQGEWPSHPALLDWLALELRKNGHHSRQLLRLLVTSAAFRQSGRVDVDAAAVDRDNRLLSWFPRRRLLAEAIRDQALYVGGLLVERTGGPSVKPMQPEGLWQEVAMTQSNTRIYKQGTGDDLWRRSLYTYWKRACPPPSLLLLDAPTREFCTVRRSSTNTPLQALVLWNDAQFVEAARALAQRTVAEANGDARRLGAMFRRCTGHELAGGNLAAAMATLAESRKRFHAAPADAHALLADAANKRTDADAAELAALTLLANAFLNLDATVCID